MSKSVIDITWTELKAMFYLKNKGAYNIDLKWEAYKLEITKGENK